MYSSVVRDRFGIWSPIVIIIAPLSPSTSCPAPRIVASEYTAVRIKFTKGNKSVQWTPEGHCG